MGTLKSVWVRAHSTPPQKSATNARDAPPLFQKYQPAHTKYTMMLRLVSCTASHTFVLPVSS
jgi:hypothetical protein